MQLWKLFWPPSSEVWNQYKKKNFFTFVLPNAWKLADSRLKVPYGAAFDARSDVQPRVILWCGFLFLVMRVIRCSLWRIRSGLCEVKKWKPINRRAWVACVRPQEETVKKTKPVKASNEKTSKSLLLSVVEPRRILTWHRFRFSRRLSLTWIDPNSSNLCPECQLLPVCAPD